MSKIAMNMILTWQPDCDFIFSGWHTDGMTQFLIANLLTFFVCILSSGYSLIQKKLLKNSESKQLKALLWMLGYGIKLMVMFLMMTMNFWINLMIILGTALGMVLINILQNNKKMLEDSISENKKSLQKQQKQQKQIKDHKCCKKKQLQQ